MKVIFLGAEHVQGEAKQGGRPFNFAQLLTAIPQEQVNASKFQKRAYGYQQGTLPLADPACLDQFASCKLGDLIDVDTDSRQTTRGVQTIVTGLKATTPKAVNS